VVSFPCCIQLCQFIPGALFGNMACAAGEHFLVGSCMLFPVLLCHEWQILLFPSVFVNVSFIAQHCLLLLAVVSL
jgi:hypothetical protein